MIAKAVVTAADVLVYLDQICWRLDASGNEEECIRLITALFPPEGIPLSTFTNDITSQLGADGAWPQRRDWLWAILKPKILGDSIWGVLADRLVINRTSGSAQRGLVPVLRAASAGVFEQRDPAEVSDTMRVRLTDIRLVLAAKVEANPGTEPTEHPNEWVSYACVEALRAHVDGNANLALFHIWSVVHVEAEVAYAAATSSGGDPLLAADGVFDSWFATISLNVVT